jgi:hypothetical protein
MKNQKAWFVALLLAVLACASEQGYRAGPTQDAGATAHDAQLAVPGSFDTCSVDTDCAWGEIRNEILKAKECPCLYGCPHIALAKSTIQRRAAQYEALCDPMHAGDGDICGIDDCAIPPRIGCNNGVCGAADAGVH